MSQPDFSDFVVHFTKGVVPFSAEMHPGETEAIAPLPAQQRLDRILRQHLVSATRMPWTDQRAVCFTECTWPSLLRHCDRYSSFGVGFRKAFIFQQGGGPAIYLRQDHYRFQLDHGGFDSRLWPFLTPFAPDYAPAAYAEYWKNAPLDFTYEREWRLPTDLQFGPQHIEFVLVEKVSDVAALSAAARAGIAEGKWIVVSNYRNIETLWPQHNLGAPV